MNPMNYIKRTIAFFPLIAAFSLHSNEVIQSGHQMMLVGGGVSICTSEAPGSCLPDTRFEHDDKPSSGKFQVEQVALLQSKDPFSRDLILDFVRQAAQLSGKEQPEVLVVTASSRNPFAAVDFYLELFTQAGAKVRWLPIHAAYQQAQRLGAESGCAQLDTLFEQYHGLTEPGKEHPNLMVYQQQFCQFGSEHSVALIDAADAIFFNGGDQSMTLQALRGLDGAATPELTAIERGLKAGTLLVGGTSAGTAVMSGSEPAAVPMITNGDSRYALAFGAHAVEPPERDCAEHGTCPAGLHESSLTYKAEGGAALFPWGILDTHFSERGREGRLLELALATDTRFGFGVDEATALWVYVPKAGSDDVWFEVQGRGGVFILDLSTAQQDQKADGKRVRQVVTHYLTHGDKARLHQGELSIQFADWKHGVADDAAKPQQLNKILQHDHFQQLAHHLCVSNQKTASGQDQLAATRFLLQLSRNDQSKSKPGVIVKDDQAFRFCSYQHMLLELSVAANP
ncbi:cyanophycinase [Alkalimonas sp.]|uniref:cyanophycinase n=1 Tax=Alkalimonas sp. TaxID=1872453 RepID=UPI00263A93A4|nr:cyanophycinase [Alkalimonas sp.]MCC5824851.1 hypothetical protein [Alkalimonas sp.]